MSKYEKHIFICENVRDEKNPTPSCGMRGGIEIKALFKRRLRELGLSKCIRANTAGCLGECNKGPTAVVYPKGTWYGNLTTENVEEIINTDLINNKVVTELEIKSDK